MLYDMTATEMVDNFVSSTSAILTDSVPFLEVFIGLFIFVMAFGLLYKAINRNMKRAFKK